MRLSRIITAVAVGVAVIGVPSAAGAAQPFTPQPPLPSSEAPSPPTDPQQPSYPPQEPGLTATDLTVAVGEPTTLVGSGFLPRELVRLTFTRVGAATPTPTATTPNGGNGGGLAAQPAGPTVLRPITVRANRDGTFRRTVRFPATGDIRVVARGLTSGRVASVVITVTGTQPSTPPGQNGGQPPLPVTGSSITPQITIGVAAVVFGSSMLVAGVLWRRRRFGVTLPGSSR